MGNKRSPVLFPFSVIYGLITGFRNFLYNAGVLESKEFNIPVICAGNITVGGTGKTPLVEYLATLLKKKYRVAVLSRGYRRTSEGFFFASAESSVNDIGDEPFMLSRIHRDIVVAVDKDRVHGINTILKDYPEMEVILMDDGFQHRRIKPGLSILLCDFNRPLAKDHMLPYGNLRESKSNLSRADIIIITKSPSEISPISRRIFLKDLNAAPYQTVFFTSVTYGSPRPVFGDLRSGQLVPERLAPSESGAVLITGIASPDPLRQYLDKYFGEIIHLDFPDHYRYTENDAVKIFNAWNNLRSPFRVAITTEKDAVRLTEFTNIAEPLKKAFYFIPAGVEFLNDTGPEFDNLILAYVRKNKRNDRVP